MFTSQCSSHLASKLALSFFFLYSQPSDVFGTHLLTPTVLKWSRISSVYYVGTKDGSVYVVDIPENAEQAIPEKLLADRYLYYTSINSWILKIVFGIHHCHVTCMHLLNFVIC